MRWGWQLSFLVVLVGIGACNRPRVSAPKPRPQVDAGIGFQNITLKQTNNVGQLLWQIQAKQATYGENQQVAQVKGIDGELFQDGKPVFKVSADQGQVRQDGKMILLQGKIIVTDLETQAVFKGQEVEWRPGADLLTISNNLSVSHPQVQLWAKVLRVNRRRDRWVAEGAVVAETRQPKLRLKTEQAVWQSDQGQIAFDAGLEVETLGEQGREATAQGGRAAIDLAAGTVTLEAPAQVNLVQPNLEVRGEQLVWNFNQQTLRGDRGVKIDAPTQTLTLRGDRVFVEQLQQRLQVSGAVRALRQRDQAVLTTDQLTWLMAAEEIQAEGNVTYEQDQPRLSLRGTRAVGNLQEQILQVSGGEVVTEIVP